MKTGANILVVDDDAFVLDSLSALLQEYGYRVTVSGSAENALGKFREASPDVVFRPQGVARLCRGIFRI